jgi:hypothetical protein
VSGSVLAAKLAGGAAALVLVVGVGGTVMLGPEKFGATLAGVFGPDVIDDGSPEWAKRARDPKWRQEAVRICQTVTDETHEAVSDTYFKRGDNTGGMLDESGSQALFDMMAPRAFAKAYDKAGFAENERRLADRMCLFYQLAGREMTAVMLNTLGDPGDYRAGYADPSWVANGSQDQRLGQHFYDDYGFDRAVKDNRLDYGSWAVLPDESHITTSMDQRLDAELIRDGWNKKSHQTTVRALRYAYDLSIAQRAEDHLKVGNMENFRKIGEAIEARGEGYR